MLFPVSGVETYIWLPPLVAFSVSFVTSMGGVSGAFLLLPFQMSFLGYTSPSVSATNQVFNIVAIPSGLYRYFREGRMAWHLAWVVVIGTLPGVFVGAYIRVAYLPDPTNFKAFAALVLLYIALRMLKDLLGKKGADKAAAEKRLREQVCQHAKDVENGAASKGIAVKEWNFCRITYDCYGQHVECSCIGVLSLSLVVGVVGGVYGIGGGSIIAPFFVSILGLPVYMVAGAALMGTFVTSIAGVAFYHAIAPFYPEMAVAPDWTLGLLFGLGGMVGMYAGARCQKLVPAKVIKSMLVIIVLSTALRYLVGWFSG